MTPHGLSPRSLRIDAVRTFLADAERGRASERGITARIKLVTRHSDQGVLLETLDLREK